MRILSVIVVTVLASTALAGCASNTKQVSRSLGLTSGPLPAPKPFVVDSRSGQADVYPVIGSFPPTRSDRVLSMDERKALEASLLATPGRQPAPDEKAASGKKGSKKKIASNRKAVGFVPPK